MPTHTDQHPRIGFWGAVWKSLPRILGSARTFRDTPEQPIPATRQLGVSNLYESE